MTIRRYPLASCLAALGASLLAAAALAGSTGTTTTAGQSGATVSRGGTLRLNISASDYEYLDPALSYDSIGWATIYAVNTQLLNYPDKPAAAGGNQLVPEAATGFPVVSKDGKTYAFTVRSGLRLSDGSPIAAAAFARSIFRRVIPIRARRRLRSRRTSRAARRSTRRRRTVSRV